MSSRGAKYWDSGAIPLIGPDILGDIIREVADVGVVITEDGQVLSVLSNPGFDLGEELSHLEGKDFTGKLTVESTPKFEERLEQFLSGTERVRPVEINHTAEGGRSEFPMRYSFHRIGPDGAVLMLGRDLRPVAEMQQQLVKAQLALERDYESQREFDTRFRVLMAQSREGVVFVSAHSGRISAINPVAAGLLDRAAETLIDTPLSDHLAKGESGDPVAQLSDCASADEGGSLTLAARHTGAHLQIVPTLFRAAGERTLLCLISPEGEAAAPASPHAAKMQALFHAAPEGIVFADAEGRVLSANDGFLDLIGVAQSTDIRGADFATFLQRGSVDFRVMTENAARTGKMRLYATKIAGDYGSPRSVEMSVTVIEAGTAKIYGFVIRDAGRSETAIAPGVGTPEAMPPVVELVGSATLKDIVAETTNVVEKMCIETAVELTMNNRVAAAEMLGLSRQSLYVKLRKFGLLERD